MGSTASFLVLAFSIKSALFPFHRWLLATLDAPTPLSGFLHAGIVNVAAVMTLKLWPVLSNCQLVLNGWGILAALSVVAGTLSMSAQPDIKRKLVYSTVGQMGFMCLQCACGATGAALFHMLAHGLFKCFMFLQSGSAVAEGLSKRQFINHAHIPTDTDSRHWLSSAFIIGSAICTCFILLSTNPSPFSSPITAVVAAAATFCAIPALRRIQFSHLALFWLTTLIVAAGSANWSWRLESLVTIDKHGSPASLDACLVLLAVLAIILVLVRNGKLGRALYVHSLNGFYIEQIAEAITHKLKTIRPKHVYASRRFDESN